MGGKSSGSLNQNFCTSSKHLDVPTTSGSIAHSHLMATASENGGELHTAEHRPDECVELGVQPGGISCRAAGSRLSRGGNTENTYCAIQNTNRMKKNEETRGQTENLNHKTEKNQKSKIWTPTPHGWAAWVFPARRPSDKISTKKDVRIFP